MNQIQEEKMPNYEKVGNKSIYQVSGFEIFWRNFLAGFSRAFGSLFIYIGLLVAISYFLMPKLLPLVNTLQESVETLTKMQNPNQNQIINNILKQPQLQNALDQINTTTVPVPR